MIRREIRKNDFNRDRTFNGGDPIPTGSADDVLSVEILRGGSSYDPEMIDGVVVTYTDSSTETVTLHRGVTPTVPSTVPDHEFINNALITSIEIILSSANGNRSITCQLVRENGYGKVGRVNFSYID